MNYDHELFACGMCKFQVISSGRNMQTVRTTIYIYIAPGGRARQASREHARRARGDSTRSCSCQGAPGQLLASRYVQQVRSVHFVGRRLHQ